MIPEKKKTPEEIAALREGLGIPPVQAPSNAEPEPMAQPAPDPSLIGAPVKREESEKEIPQPEDDGEPVIHLGLPPKPARFQVMEAKPVHSLRKQELPLAPAPATIAARRTELPTQRHDPRDVAQIRKREALAALAQPRTDPAAHLRRQTASPFLYAPGYLLAIAAGVSAYLRVHYMTPATLIGLAIFIMVFIALRKPRSRHHAALLFIFVFLTLVFGALHYAPLFQYGP